ncbi:hypothetical protein D3C80_1585300 [compost metagenome]
MKKACEFALQEYGTQSGSDFDIVVMSAVDIMAGKKLPKKNKNGTLDRGEVEKKGAACKMQ